MRKNVPVDNTLVLLGQMIGLVVVMFFLAGGFFLVHALLSGLANHLAEEHKGVVNGLYVSIYYFSGALGSWLPGYLFDGLGWHGMIYVFISILGVSAWWMSSNNARKSGNSDRFSEYSSTICGMTGKFLTGNQF